MGDILWNVRLAGLNFPSSKNILLNFGVCIMGFLLPIPKTGGGVWGGVCVYFVMRMW